ncbi:MAG: T9SS type A sorting domain-containing protein [Bacteroidales bacterium]|nr:T9SS type A sorting domain-containing protein [Bacteroidales bacterium]
MTAVDNLEMTGTPVTDLASNTISLSSGYNMISYLPEDERDAETVFSQGLGDNDGDLTDENLDFVRDSEGNHLWDVGGWTNNIGNLKPGEGYFVKMSASGTLDYSQSNPTKSGDAINADNDPVYFTFEGGDPIQMLYTIYISSDNLEAGDEVAAFNNGIMVGSTVIEDPNEATKNNLNIFRVLDSGEGFEPGNDVTLKVWSPRTNQVYTNPEVEYKDLNGEAWTKSTYPAQDEQYSIIDLSVKALGVEEGHALAQVQVYPNPANSRLHIKSEEKITNIRITNTVGQVLISRDINTDNYTVNVNKLESGIYILEATINGQRSSLRFAVK